MPVSALTADLDIEKIFLNFAFLTTAMDLRIHSKIVIALVFVEHMDHCILEAFDPLA
jgi:hypothetical protein